MTTLNDQKRCELRAHALSLFEKITQRLASIHT